MGNEYVSGFAVRMVPFEVFECTKGNIIKNYIIKKIFVFNGIIN